MPHDSAGPCSWVAGRLGGRLRGWKAGNQAQELGCQPPSHIREVLQVHIQLLQQQVGGSSGQWAAMNLWHHQQS